MCSEENKVKVICAETTALTIGLFENSSEDCGINSGWQHLRFRHQKHLHCLIVDKPSLDIRVLALRFALCFVFFKYIFICLGQSGVIFREIDILYLQNELY